MKIEATFPVYVDNIGLQGPIYAVHIRAERLYVFTDYRALSSDRAAVERFAEKVRKAEEFNPDLWQFGDMTDAERERHYRDMYEWEETEKLAGRW